MCISVSTIFCTKGDTALLDIQNLLKIIPLNIIKTPNSITAPPNIIPDIKISERRTELYFFLSFPFRDLFLFFFREYQIFRHLSMSYPAHRQSRYL